MTRVAIEVGRRRVFAIALDWPGWVRGARDEAAALALLADYAPRYGPVAGAAGQPAPGLEFEVVERQPGNATTEFGAPAMIFGADREPLPAAEAARLAALLDAAWSTLDAVVAAAPPALRKGPRGGGRDRDQVRDHVTGAEAAYLPKIGPRQKGAEAVRDGFREALRRPDETAPWPRRYAVRRVAWHALDHAWEIEDRTEPS